MTYQPASEADSPRFAFLATALLLHQARPGPAGPLHFEASTSMYQSSIPTWLAGCMLGRGDVYLKPTGLAGIQGDSFCVLSHGMSKRCPVDPRRAPVHGKQASAIWGAAEFRILH